MTERVIIEVDAGEDIQAARAALEKHAGFQDITHQGGNVLSVIVHDSRDAEEEVTEVLNVAGVTAYVYT